MRFKFLFLLLIASKLSSSLEASAGFFEPWGKDADLKHTSSESPIEKTTSMSLMARLAEQIILFHQNIITKIDGPRSHFRPTSSRYMLLAIRRHGFIKGYLLGCDRLLRENEDPWIYRKKEINGKLYKWDPPP